MKIDVAQIEGYENMTPEQKIAALEGFDMPDPDYSGYVKKDVFDKTASELAATKKELKDKLSDEEKAKLEAEQKSQELQANYEKLLRESNISKATAKFLALGYDDKLAAETAEAYVDGDTEKVFANQQKAQAAFEKKIRADALKNTPKPTPDGDSKTMTLKQLRAMTLQERYQYSVEHPSEYKELYGGNE